LARNYADMTNEDIFNELIYQVNGYEEVSVSEIFSFSSFNIGVKSISVNDIESGIQFDLGPIPDPMILEKGENYMIGRSKDELMAAITYRLKVADTGLIKINCEHVIEQANKYINELGLELKRVAVYILTPIKSTKIIKKDLNIFFKKEYPKIKPRIYFEKVNGCFSLSDIFPGFPD
jgi:hypothetical protein